MEKFGESLAIPEVTIRHGGSLGLKMSTDHVLTIFIDKKGNV